MDRGAWQAPVHGVARVPYDLVTKPQAPRTNPDSKPPHLLPQVHSLSTLSFQVEEDAQWGGAKSGDRTCARRALFCVFCILSSKSSSGGKRLGRSGCFFFFFFLHYVLWKPRIYWRLVYSFERVDFRWFCCCCSCFNEIIRLKKFF